MIELVKPEFVKGDEKRFNKFVSELKSSDKIALISHESDPDGIISAKIVNAAVKTDFIKFVGYTDANIELVKEVKKSGANKVIITDLYIKDRNFLDKLAEFSEILIIDHHLFENDWNSDKIIFMNAQEFCAAYLTYYLFRKTKDIEKYDWLVACASVSDWQYTKNARWMEEVYEKYKEKFSPTIEGIKKSKFFEIVDKISLGIIYHKKEVKIIYEQIGEKFGDIGNIEKHSAEVRDEINKLLIDFEKNKINIKDGFFYEIESRLPLSSYLCTTISSKIQNKTIIISQKENDIYKMSARRQDKKESMDSFLRELVSGLENSKAGGHTAAAGASFMLKDLEEFKKRIKNL